MGIGRALAAPLLLIARLGRWVLPLGLAAGMLLPDTAVALCPWLPEMVTLLLMLSAFRIGLRQGIGSGPDLWRTLGVLAVLQVLLPALVAGGLGLAGVSATPVLVAVVLMLTGSSISGAPNLCLMMGHPPAMALRLLLIGTALLPFSALGVLSLWPELIGDRDILPPILRLLAAVLGGGTLGFVLRALLARHMTGTADIAVDGASTLLLAVMVVGLMSAMGPALRTEPVLVLSWLGLAFALNFGLQILTFFLLRSTALGPDAGAIAVVAGNRNIALFLVALPAGVIDPVLLFIGCYQIPMYLTPLLLTKLFAPAGQNRSGS